jgi:hypothetical protein
MKYTVMKPFKVIDFWMSVGLIAFFTVLGFVKMDETFLYGYFIVGGWQIISMAIHFINKWFCNNGTARYNYQRIVFVIILISLLGLLIKPLLFLALLLLVFAAPVMAVYYAFICHEEVYIKMQRPLALLK